MKRDKKNAARCSVHRAGILLFFAVMLMLSGCAGDRISRSFACRFYYYMQYHNPSLVRTAALSTSTFVMVSVTRAANGAYTVSAVDQSGHSETVRLTNEVETRRYSTGIYLGAANGIILGCEGYDNRLVAYDRQCPNCISERGGRSYPLSFTGAMSTVRCGVCGRTYDLYTGNVTAGGKSGDDRLMEYSATINGDMLYVGN